MCAKSTRPACDAGASPKITPAAIDAPSANSITVQLIDRSFSRGRLSGISRSKNPFMQNRITNPATPPSSESSRLSVSNCRTSRLRAAPSAWRTAISRDRELARASSRFATFTQPISNTSATAPSSRISDCRTLPTTFSFSGTNRTVHLLSAG